MRLPVQKKCIHSNEFSFTIVVENSYQLDFTYIHTQYRRNSSAIAVMTKEREKKYVSKQTK